MQQNIDVPWITLGAFVLLSRFQKLAQCFKIIAIRSIVAVCFIKMSVYSYSKKVLFNQVCINQSQLFNRCIKKYPSNNLMCEIIYDNQSWDYRKKFGISVSVSVLKNTDIEFSVSVLLSTDTDTESMFSVLFSVFLHKPPGQRIGPFLV